MLTMHHQTIDRVIAAEILDFEDIPENFRHINK